MALPSWPNHLPKATPPNFITWRIGISILGRMFLPGPPGTPQGLDGEAERKESQVPSGKIFLEKDLGVCSYRGGVRPLVLLPLSLPLAVGPQVCTAYIFAMPLGAQEKPAITVQFTSTFVTSESFCVRLLGGADHRVYATQVYFFF